MPTRERLDNGLTLLFEDVPGVRSASIGVWLRMGSRHESPRLSGICHFIEHLVFKGTAHRTAREISLIGDRIGGHLDAFTTKEMTCFYARTLDEHLPIAVDLLADIVRNPLFDGEEMERERGVILEEIRMVSDSPEDRIYDLFAETIWPRHPLGRPIQGTEETIGAMTRRTVLGFFKRAYVPANIIVSVAGHIGQRGRRLVRKAFADLEPGEPARTGRPPRWNAELVKEHRRQMEQVHLLLGVPGLPAEDDERFTLHMLNTILGGSMSSRLFQKIREERGLVYAVASSAHGHRGAGLLSVYAGTSPARAAEVVGVTLGEMRDLAEHGPTQEEWEVARDHLKGSLLLALESTSSRMSRMAREEMVLGRQMSPQEIVESLEAATPDRVRALAGRLFDRQRVALAAVGKTTGVRVRERDLEL
jgi:predicted Zn-dependent peptidase